MSVQGPVTKDFDDFLRRNFIARDASMYCFGFRRRDVALVLEAPDDARGIAGFLGSGTGIFRC
jgi:hypothetical protein